MRRRKLKVAVRRSHAAYRRRSLGEGLTRAARLILALAAAAGLAWGARRAWSDWALLRISSIQIEGPAPAGFERALGLRAGDPLLGLASRGRAGRLLARFPQIESVRVTCGWDRVVRARIRLRTALARVGSAGEWLGVDASGRVFPMPEPGADLPVLAYPSVQGQPARAVALLEALRSTGEAWTAGLAKITMSDDGEAILVLPGDTPIHWGEVALGGEVVRAKARRLGRVLSSPEAAAGLTEARFVDDHRIVIKPKEGAHAQAGHHYGT